MSTSLHEILVTENVAEQLMFNQRLQALAPFLLHASRKWLQLSKTSEGCGGCGRSRPRVPDRMELLQQVKSNILQSSQGVKNAIKEVLAAKTVVVPVATGAGGAYVRHSF